MSCEVDNNKIEKKNISKKEGVQIVLWSYRLSQGDIMVQRHIIDYVRRYYKKINDSSLFQDKSIGVYAQLMKNSRHKEVEQRTLEEEAGRLKWNDELLSGKEGYVKLIEKIASGILEADHKYLLTNKGRPKSAFREDGMRSYLLYYGKDSNSTGVEVFDEMMMAVWNSVCNIDTEVDPRIKELEVVHIPSQDFTKPMRKKVEKVVFPSGCPMHNKS